MMYPTVPETDTGREVTDVFAGYHHSLRIGDGEFYDMENLTSDDYPVLSSRRGRGSVYDEAAVIVGKGVPTETTAAAFIGQLYRDEETETYYRCTGIEEGTGTGTEIPPADGVEGVAETEGEDVTGDTVYTWSQEINPHRGIDGVTSAVLSFCTQGNGCVQVTDEPCVIYTKNGYLYADESLVGKGGLYTPGRPQIARMGTSVVVFPEGFTYDFAAKKEGRIGASFSKDRFSVTMCTAEGDDYAIADVASDTEPKEPENGDLWIDTGSEPHALKKYASATGRWVTVPTSYLKIAADGIGEFFNEGDGVRICFTYTENGEEILALDGSYVLTKVYHNPGAGAGVAATDSTPSSPVEGSGDYLVIVGFTDRAFETKSHELSVWREFPVLIEHVFESGNRLWGCRFGSDVDGTVHNEIYASKLGDFKNWNCFAGLSTDSYAVSVGSDGPFTGGIHYLGQPLFFKERCMHRIYGMYPAAYQLQTTDCPGVQLGSGHSLTVVDGVLYYKGVDAVYAYDGSMPVSLSDKLGNLADRVCTSACGYRHKLYMILQQAGEPPVLFIYDTRKGLWHKETFGKEVTGAHDLCEHEGVLYCVETTEDGERIRALYGDGDEPVTWMAETGILGVSSPDKKYISRLNVRLQTALGSRVAFYAQYDSLGGWEHLGTVEGVRLRTFNLPIRPKRCDHFRLRVVGEGEAKIFSITKTTAKGSDVS